MRERSLQMFQDGRRLRRWFFEKIPKFFFSLLLFANLLIYSNLLFRIAQQCSKRVKASSLYLKDSRPVSLLVVAPSTVFPWQSAWARTGQVCRTKSRDALINSLCFPHTVVNLKCFSLWKEESWQAYISFRGLCRSQLLAQKTSLLSSRNECWCTLQARAHCRQFQTTRYCSHRDKYMKGKETRNQK